MVLDVESNTVLLRGLADIMSRDDFLHFCMANKDLRIERDESGNVLIKAPVTSDTGRFEADLVFYLSSWNKEKGDPGVVFSPSTGFTLPDSSMRSPDAAWIAASRWQSLPKEERQRFAALPPDFIAEIRSPSDSLVKLKAKMTKWIDNGVKLAWLIDPGAQNAWVYRANGEIELVEGVDAVLTGEELLPGLEVPLSLFAPEA